MEYLFSHQVDENLTVRQNFRYSHVDVGQGALWPSGLGDDDRTLSRYSYGDTEHNDAAGVDTQVELKASTGPLSHTLLVGVDYFHYHWDQVSSFGFSGIPGIDVFSPTYGYAVSDPPVGYSALTTIEQVGIYAQDQIRWDKWVLMISGRQDWANGSYNDRLAETTTTQADHAFTWRVGLVYTADNGLAPYASYAKSFNPTTAEASGTDYAGNPFKPTTAQQYEVGVKYQPPGMNSFITVAGYQLTEQNVTTTDPLHPNFDIQAGEIRSRGAEVTAVASLAAGLDLTAAYSYTDNVVTESSNQDSAFGIEAGNTPPNVPAHMASLWADYTFQNGPLTGFGLAGGVRYVGARQGDQLDSFQVPSYTLGDAAIHYDLGALVPDLIGAKLALNVSNLFDKEYIAYCYTVNYCSFGPRRTVTATLKYQW
ncbi:MAG: TonB-dependent siderophore receptor [Azospirillaceae bacterium]|nr:TonB-dependent siderophore receptor [Azospirillaceae bacterium]